MPNVCFHLVVSICPSWSVPYLSQSRKVQVDKQGYTLTDTKTSEPIKPIKQQDPTEDTTSPAAPTEVEGPPSSCLRSKMKQQPTSDKQGQPEHNPTPMDPLECNPAEIEVNSIDIAPKNYSWMRLTKFLSYSKKTINDPAPVSLP